jgi:hypothetical protein
VLLPPIAGDATLDRKVDVADLGILASHWQGAGNWSAGDFDGDGIINVNDLGLLATNWQQGVSGPLLADLAALGLPAVPEPAAASGVLALLFVQAAGRRRRNYSSRGGLGVQ